MKIVYICADNLAKKKGSTVHTIEIARNLKMLGAEILIFALSLGRFKEEKGLNIQYIPTLNIKLLRPLSYRLSLSIMLFWKLLVQRVDIIYVRETALYLAPFILGKVFKKPTIIEVNDTDVDGSISKPNKAFSILKVFIRRISFKLADKIIVANEKVREILSKDYATDKRRFAVIPMGANTDLFRPMDKDKCRQIVHLKKDCKYLGFIGTLYPFQGLEYLIEAAPRILKKSKNIKFLIVGSGVNEDNIKDLVKRRNLIEYFIFEGEKEYRMIPYYINSFDICISFVAPKRSRTFSFPLKIYEYIACRRPVVIGNLKNASILLNRRITPVIDADNPEVLSKTILELLEHLDDFEDESSELRKLVVENFSWRRTAERTLELFNRMRLR